MTTQDIDTTDLAPEMAPIRADAADEIPILDMSDYRAGKPGAAQALAAELRYALENVGFYFLVNHGLPRTLVNETMAAAKDLFDLPMENKMAVLNGENQSGYVPVNTSVVRHSKINANNKPNFVESFFVKRELDPSHPDVLAGVRFRPLNRWPEGDPTIRQRCLAYVNRIEGLAKSMLPIYALALELPADFFEVAFTEPMYTMRMSHYPQQESVDGDTLGLAPHTDTSFMTMLPFNEIAGLSIRMPNGKWADVPQIPDSFVVNSGDLIRRWTNERFLSTPHRVINRSGKERYAIPFFMDCNIRHSMTCIPTCLPDGQEPKYPPMTYTEYYAWYKSRNYA